MTTLDRQWTLGELVAQQPAAAAVLERKRIDYCCGGQRSLADVCAQEGIDLEELLQEINDAVKQQQQRAEGDQLQWLEEPLAKLCDHIEQTHHQYLKCELPRLTELINKVVSVHGDSHAELKNVQRVFAELRAELEPHMMKEERILFPAIRQLEQAGSGAQLSFPFGTVANPIRMMEHEHDTAGNALKALRQVTHDYQLPEDACPSYKELYRALQELEQDLHQHIHKENNILFPRAQALETAS